MKAIMISIRPKWVAKILNGEKTIEIRKRFPSDYVGWVYIYCTKDKKYANLINRGGFLTGMVVARFWCDKVDKVHLRFEKYCAGELSQDGLLKYACLTEQELDNYLWSNICCGYAIHITKLEIFDKPKEIKDFSVYSHSVVGTNIQGETTSFKILKPLSCAPQSWCYIYE